jgi:predicted nuclease of restriction endonuclease-like (RecB) superfamily
MNKMSNSVNESGEAIYNQLFSKVAELIDFARTKIATTVNITMVNSYFDIGRMIVEDEQQGKERAEYGKSVLKELSKQLIEKFGKGFSVDNLERMKNFYLIYSNQISAKVLRKSEDVESQSNNNSLTTFNPFTELQTPRFLISWSHYLILMRIENPNERSFYEIECAANNWSLKDLKRQYHSSLYERLALSRNKDDVMKLANEGHTLVRPEDILKNPLSLEFLGLEEKVAFTESDMEHAILSKLQQFILELGKGFLFEARQKRFTLTKNIISWIWFSIIVCCNALC